MSYKWPDTKDLGLEIFLNQENEQSSIVVLSNKDDTILDFYMRELSQAQFVEGLIDDKRCFFKTTDSFTLDDLTILFPQFNRKPKIKNIFSIDDVLIDGYLIKTNDITNKGTDVPSNDLINGFEEFMINEFVPRHIRNKHVEAVNGLLGVFTTDELSENLYSIDEIKQEFLSEGGNLELVKRKRIECAYPFFLEYMRRRNLGLETNSGEYDENQVEDFYEFLSEKAINGADSYRDRNVFLNLFDRNMHITGSKFMIDYVLSNKELQKKMSSKIKKNWFELDPNQIDMRFGMLRDKQKIHYKSPVITTFEKKTDRTNGLSFVEQIGTKLLELKNNNVLKY
jgi:hypothetical protein